MRPRALQRIYKHGNCTAVSIPRHMLVHLGWLPGEAIIVELAEGCECVLVRRPTLADFPNVKAPSYVLDPTGAAK